MICYITRHSSSTELYHHGILGQKWGIRRTPAQLGYPTPTPRKTADGKIGTYKTKGHVDSSDYGTNKSKIAKGNNSYVKTALTHPISTAKAYVANKIDIIQRTDKYLDAGTELARIQTEKEVTPYAFYATYKKHDVDEYAGLFGANLKSRANAAAKQAEKAASKKTATDELKADAEAKRKYANELNVYQVKFSALNKLKVPSDKNAADIVADLYKDNSFRSDLSKSINNSRANMRRPKQQALLADAQRIMRDPSNNLSSKDRATMYKALNLSLTFHDDYHNRTQDKFYGALKKKGYSAIVDLNDQKYSSYHAKKPMIVFDTNAVSIKSIKPLDQHYMDKMNKKYNRERYVKEFVTQLFTAVPQYSKARMSDAYEYRNTKVQQYLESDSGADS